jgi:hypothetical protein
MTLLGLNRYQVFAIHMAISLVLFFILLACITQVWYPGILFDTGNGWKAIALIVGIDLILGPLLTLIVFNPKKSSLKFDLWVIAIVQTAALIYGTWTIYSSRPLAIAYINTSFITFYANAENALEIKDRVAAFNTRQLFYVFDDDNSSNTLKSDQLQPYLQYANTVPNLTSPYKIPSTEGDTLLVKIDPLASRGRYLIINKDNGAIIGFTKLLNDASETTDNDKSKPTIESTLDRYLNSIE